MRFSKFIKVAAIALPLIAVTACSSNSSNNSVDGNGSLSKEALAQLQKLQQANTVYFDYDKYNVKPEYSTLLNEHAALIRANSSLNVVIEGHADERGTPEYNIALGERRAAAVKSYLQGNGVSGEQLSIVSYGKEKPAVLGHNEEAYAKNRRAVVTYVGY
jgi:peptidoglycan-associated lipoprotein